MAGNRLTKAAGDYARGFVSEDNKNYRTEHQELAPAMARVKAIRESQEQHGTGRYDRRFVGSVPISIITDWCKRNGFTFDQWARNEGGIKGEMYPASRSGVKDKFMAYFLTRDFSRLHTQHSTTRLKTGIIVPNSFRTKGDKNGDIKSSGAKVIDS